jgi:hypothetical protein
MLTGKRRALFLAAWPAIVAGVAVVSSTAYGIGPAIPKIEDSAGWQLSEGCRVYKFGILTDPDCDVLTGHGIAIQITRIRLLSLPPGQDDRATIGIELQADDDGRYFSSPFVGLTIAGRSYPPPEIDQALVFAKRDRPIFPEKLRPNQQRYRLPPGEKRFFRLRFSVSQSELGAGFELQVTGLQSEGETLQVPTVQFRWASSARAPQPLR